MPQIPGVKVERAHEYTISLYVQYTREAQLSLGVDHITVNTLIRNGTAADYQNDVHSATAGSRDNNDEAMTTIFGVLKS